MCGIVGLMCQEGDVWTELYDSLIQLQHRGQDAAGVITCTDKFHTKRGKGLVREVFGQSKPTDLPGQMGIGHVRYPTQGGNTIEEIQPFWISQPYGLSLAHNGTLTNYQSLKQRLLTEEHQHLNTESDSELLLHYFSRRLASMTNQHSFSFFDKLCHAIKFIFDHIKGGYAVVSTVLRQGLCAFRDPNGIRPLVIGQRVATNGRMEYIIASEPTMFFQLGFERLDDVQPGEVVYVDTQGQLFRRQICKKKFAPCAFEYIYFARPDAKLNDISVYRSRLRMGQNLAMQWLKTYPKDLPDVVIPIPFTSNTAALAFANALNIRYTEGLYKNPFIGRTFIMPSKKKRQQSVRYKLSPQETEIKGKRVLLLDDSIVRGTTSKEIVSMVRELGAEKVYFASASPEVRYPCFYGIDMPTQQEFIAFNRNPEQIKQYLKVDRLLYQSVPGLKEAILRKGKHQIDDPCLACLNGHYVCGKAEGADIVDHAVDEQSSELEMGEI